MIQVGIKVMHTAADVCVFATNGCLIELPDGRLLGTNARRVAYALESDESADEPTEESSE